MNFFRAMDISASGLTAQRMRMDIISENIANQSTTRTAEGTPYRRKYVVLQENTRPYLFSEIYSSAITGVSGPMGVKAVRIGEDQSALKLVYDPEHPDANEDGYVELPNVDMVKEMVDMIDASRSFEANITAINNFKNMAGKALEIGRGR